MTHQMRYTVEENGREFGVFDNNQNRYVCNCVKRADAGMIAGLLNQEETKEFVRSIP